MHSRLHRIRAARFASDIGAFAGIILALAGCTSASMDRKLEVRGELDVAGVKRAAVVVVHEPHEFATVVPLTGKEVAESAYGPFGEVGSLDGPLIADVGIRNPLVMVLAVPFLAAIHVVGSAEAAVVRTVAGTSQHSTDEKQAAISVAVRGLPLDETVAKAVQSRLQSLLDQPFTRLEDVTETPKSEARRNRPREFPAANATPRDMVVRVKIFFQGLQTRRKPSSSSSNPPLALVLAVQLMAVNSTTGEMVGGTSVAYESTPRTFMAWGENNAAALRAEIAAAESEMTAAIVAQIRG